MSKANRQQEFYEVFNASYEVLLNSKEDDTQEKISQLRTQLLDITPDLSVHDRGVYEQVLTFFAQITIANE